MVLLFYIFRAPMPFELSVFVLFVSLMQLVNKATFLIIIFYLSLEAAVVPVLGTVIDPLTSIYESLK